MANNKQSESSHGLQTWDVSNCRGKYIKSAELVECLTPKLGCPHAMLFGNSHYCRHPDKMKIVQTRM